MLIKEREKLTSGVKTVLTMLDRGSFVELGADVTDEETDIYFPESVSHSDGVVTGYGSIGGKTAYIFCQDGDTMGGTLGVAHARKICSLYRLAKRAKAPIIGVLNSSGLRIEEGADGLNAFASLCKEVLRAKEDIPEIFVVAGECVGSMAALARMGDFLFDGADEATLEKVRQLLGFLPSAKGTMPEAVDTQDDLNRLCRGLADKADKPMEIMREISDDNFVLEVNEDEGNEMATAFIRLDGRPVGVVANAPGKDGDRGITCRGLKKASEFAELCDGFNIPLLTIVNNTGIGTAAMGDGQTAEETARLAHALAGASVPKICLLTGEAVGIGYTVMNSKGLGADMVFAWPEAKVLMINARQAVQILQPDIKAAEIHDKAQEYEAMRGKVEILLERGYADKVISPEASRKYIIGALEAFSNAF